MRQRVRRDVIKLLLIRHGQTEWNKERRIQGGRSDTTLSPAGKQQADEIGQALSNTEISAIYSSPLIRAINTAKAIALYHHIDIKIEPDLRELEVGEMEGKAISSLVTDFSHYLLQWNAGLGTEKLPGGESLSDLRERAWNIITRISAKHREETVVVVSHYFVILTIICAALNIPLPTLRKMRAQPASISIITINNNLNRLDAFGISSHLSGNPV